MEDEPEDLNRADENYYDASGYMTRHHPLAFVDMRKKKHPKEMYPGHDDWIICPKCGGYGGWHLKLNAYKSEEFPHFNCACSQCNGWGYISPKDASCIHEWKTRHIEMHTREDTCVKCGQVRYYDTSG